MGANAAMKGPDAFRTISEVAGDLDLPQHVLRFWETRFSQIKPMKRGGGRRYYRPDDVDLLRGIRLLLYGEGFTIKGVQRLLREKGVTFVSSVGQSGSVETVVETVSGGDAAGIAAPDHGDSDDPIEPRVGATGPGNGSAPLTAGGRRQLEAVLSQLLEAKRVLDQARS
ncbi:MAG: MerR family transcriptional regulator [Alphaproteobacteria bacterium]